MRRAVLLPLLLLLSACHGDTGTADTDVQAADQHITTDVGPSGREGVQFDDSGSTDGAPTADVGGLGPDAGVPLDLTHDSSTPAPDLPAPKPDLKLAPDKGTPPAGLSVPCQQGPGWTLFRFHYGGSSKSPQIDVWDASCSYSYTPNSACNVYAVYPGFGSVSYTSQGYPILTSSEYLRVRFSVAGLSFTKAAVYIQARSYATASSTNYEVWSPLYGGLIGGPVDNDWIYDWYSLDWSAHLKPTDQPSLTAIQIYANQGSGQLAVKAVELCVQ